MTEQPKLTRAEVEQLLDHYTPYRPFQDSEEDAEVRLVCMALLAADDALKQIDGNGDLWVIWKLARAARLPTSEEVQS